MIDAFLVNEKHQIIKLCTRICMCLREKRRVGGKQEGREMRILLGLIRLQEETCIMWFFTRLALIVPIGCRSSSFFPPCHQPSPGKPKPQVPSQFSLQSFRLFPCAGISQLVLTGENYHPSSEQIDIRMCPNQINGIFINCCYKDSGGILQFHNLL